jgi:hypothetical protein
LFRREYLSVWLRHIHNKNGEKKDERLRELIMYCSTENIYWQQTKISAVNSFLSEILQKYYKNEQIVDKVAN